MEVRDQEAVEKSSDEVPTELVRKKKVKGFLFCSFAAWRNVPLYPGELHRPC